MSMVRLPGLIDVHVHLREPGGVHKEDLASGTAAALAGGFTMVLDMPNNTPPTVDHETLAAKRRSALGRLRCDVGMYLGASSAGRLPDAVTAALSAGLKVYLDSTFGPLRLTDLGRLQDYLLAWPRTRPVLFHAEELSLPVAIALGSVFDRPVHICHVSRAAELRLIQRAKERGLAVTCEVTPHHLFLTVEDARALGPYADMRPMLATQSDVDYLWQHLDAIDVIATDHAPHTRAEKDGHTPPPGVPGLETALPLMLTAVAEGRLSLQRVVEMMHAAPRRIFGLPEQADTWIEVDADEQRTIPSSGFFSRCNWSPFAGRRVIGRVRRVTLRGDIVFDADAGQIGEARGRVLF